MNAASYVLTCGLLEGLPLCQRSALTAFLRRVEPHPQDARQAEQILHLNGFMLHGKLTPEGVLAALEPHTTEVA